MAKISIDLQGSEHVGEHAVRIKLSKRPDGDVNRFADVKLSSDGMQVKVYMMESDLRILAHAILNNTNPALDDQA